MLLTIPLFAEMHRDLAIFPTIIVYGVLETLLLAKWGAWLPSVIAEGDRSFAAAGRRGSKTFVFVFLRLISCAGLGYVASFLFLFVAVHFSGTDGTYWTQASGPISRVCLLGWFSFLPLHIRL
jgi:hypothetical protein